MDGAVKFNVSANTAQFDAAMGRVGNSARTASDQVMGAFNGLGAMLAGGGVVAGMNAILRKMDDISDQARRLGMSSVEIQKIGNAAELVGTNVETVVRAMNRAGVAANKAAREGGAVADAFARVNIDPARFAAADLEGKIRMVAAAQQSANGNAQEMANLFEAIGVRAAGIDFSALLEEMSGVSAASNETVEALARANDQLDIAKQNATILGANLLKGVSDFGERLGNILGSGGDSPLEKIKKQLQFNAQLTPAGPLLNMLGLGGKTNAEVDAQIERDNAIARLRGRGELLLNQQGKTIEASAFFPNTEAGRKAKAEAEENERRIKSEIKAQEDLNKAKKEEARLAKETAKLEQEQLALTNTRGEKEKDIARPRIRQNADKNIPLPGNNAVAPTESLSGATSSGSSAAAILNPALEMPNWQRQDLLQKLAKGKLNSFTDNAIAGLFNPQLQMPHWQRIDNMNKLLGMQQEQEKTSQLATESTLKEVVKIVRNLDTKLPQPVLT